MKKILEKSLNNVLVLLVILNMVSYQIILPISISRAEDTGGEAVESVSESSFSDSSAQANADEEADADEAEAQENASTEEAQAEEADDEVASSATDEAGSAVTQELAPASSADPLTIQEVVLPSGENSVVENADICACQNDLEENNTDSEEKTCPSDCACCQTEVVQVNVAEDVASTTESLSETGGNEISGEVIADPAVQADPTIDGTPLANQEETNNCRESDNDSCDNDCGEGYKENEAVIVTGDAVADAMAVNHINTNIYTDNGVQYEETITGDFTGDINLIDAFDAVIDGAQNLNEANEKAFEQIAVTNVNIAEKVDNTVLASANSGDNLIEALDGIAEIKTGAAEAVASAVNFVNTNIVGNNWLFAEINILGNWTGNLIVPGEGLFSLPSAGMVFESITNINLAKSITNFLSSNANSGNNSISAMDGDMTVVTGDAVALSSATTLVNTNIVKNNWFYLLINNAGSWIGQVYNWSNGSQNLAYQYNFGNLEGVDMPITKSVSVYNYNSAEEVNNSVSANANSGGNTISGVTGDATIVTGDAVARASAFNFINTNIVGNNWFMAVVNNAGTWNGDLIFGYPDLVANLSGDKSVLEPGKNLTYTVRYKNIGQAKCGNVELMLSLPEQFIYQADSLGNSRRSGNDYFWSVPGIKAGEEKTFDVTVMLDPKTADNIVALESVAGVKTDTQEVNLNNNYATDSISVTFSQVTIQEGLPEKNGKLSVKREGDRSVAVGSISTQTIFVKNSGKDTLYNLEVSEVIKNPVGEEIVEYIWPIEKLKKGQTATIQYQILVGPDLALGDYRHSASAKAEDKYGREVKGGKATQIVTFFRHASEQALSGDEDSGVEQEVALGAEAEKDDQTPKILGVTSERNFAWQWLLLLLLIPVVYYARKERIYRWETIQKFSRQMGSFLSSFL